MNQRQHLLFQLLHENRIKPKEQHFEKWNLISFFRKVIKEQNYERRIEFHELTNEKYADDGRHVNFFSNKHLCDTKFKKKGKKNPLTPTTC